MVRLDGPHVVLREWQPDELDAMHRWLGDAAVMRFLSWGSKNRAESARHLAACILEQGRADRERYFLAMELKTSGRVIGDAGFQWTRGAGRSGREGRLGYFLEPAHWGCGYATEAAALVLHFAFHTCGATTIRASCDARNAASERVLQKIGMRRDVVCDPAGRREYVVERVSPGR